MGTSEDASSEDFVLLQGLRDTRGALDRWRADPGPVLGRWLAWSAAVALCLLSAVWLVSLVVTPDLTPIGIAGATHGADGLDYLSILVNNLLVLALHATACVAGFIAGSSLRHEARRRTGLSRWVHEKAGPVAIAWVVLVTSFSLLTQSVALGIDAAAIASQLQISSLALVASVLPHAVLELTAVFLPLAAWLIASRRDEWSDLLAATMVTVAIALPVLFVAALLEITLWPRILEAISPVLA